MTELSLHILDIIQNSIVAGARIVHLTIIEDLGNNFLSIEILDDGKGMDNDELEKADDPYFTSRTTRKVGLGVSLFKHAAHQCNGTFSLQSEVGIGTRVSATFSYNHLDRQPLGDIAGVICLMTNANPGIDFIYEHLTNNGKYIFDTREVKEIMEGIPLNDPKVTKFIKEMIYDNLKKINIAI